MINIRKLEAELWESADLLRAGSDFPALRLQPLQSGGGIEFEEPPHARRTLHRLYLEQGERLI